MRNFIKKIAYFLLAALAGLLPATLFAQTFQGKIPNMRAYDQSGINVFEPSKKDTFPFEGMKFRVGAGFTQPLA